jgi:polyhydroxyalkanoate synthesis regulator phasin
MTKGEPLGCSAFGHPDEDEGKMGDNGTKPSEMAEPPEHQTRGGLAGAAVDLALASIGAAALLREEAQVLYRRSIERGRAEAQQLQARLKVVRLPKKVSARAPSTRSRRALSASEEWRAALERLDLPTATQVKALTQHVADLEARIDQLKSAG